MLFPDLHRHDESPKRARESSFVFLNRSSRPEIGRVRELLNRAMENYQVEETAELLARFQSTDEQAFRSASFELLVHEALRRQGYSLVPHPVLDNGQATKPDFLVTGPDEQSFYLEAVLASSRNGTNPAAEAMKATALDALSQAPHGSFRIDVDSEGDPTSQPSGRSLVREIHAWLNTLDPDVLFERMTIGGLDDMPEYQWRHETWEMKIRPLPIRPERRGSAQTLLGAYGDEGRILDDWTPLRDAIKKKGRKYGNLQRPLIVAINAESFNLDRIDEMQALFGQRQYVERIGRPDLGGEFQFVPNGAWSGPHGAQCRRVSGAWFFNDLTPYSVATRRNTLYINPWSHNEVPGAMLQFPHARVVNDRLVNTPGSSFREIYDLSPEWPE